jgi:hypothetical protein
VDLHLSAPNWYIPEYTLESLCCVKSCEFRTNVIPEQLSLMLSRLTNCKSVNVAANHWFELKDHIFVLRGMEKFESIELDTWGLLGIDELMVALEGVTKVVVHVRQFHDVLLLSVLPNFSNVFPNLRSLGFHF